MEGAVMAAAETAVQKQSGQYGWKKGIFNLPFFNTTDNFVFFS